MNEMFSLPLFIERQNAEVEEDEFELSDFPAPIAPSIELRELNVFKITEPIAIFDMNANITIFIDDHPVPATIFDYLNPLILNPVRLHKICFYEDQQRTEIVKCWCLKSRDNLETLLDQTISYPKNYFLNYKQMTVHRSGHPLNFWKAFQHEENSNQDDESMASVLRLLDTRLRLHFNQ